MLTFHTTLDNALQSIVNFNISKTKLLSINHLRDPLLLSIGIADAILQESDSLHLLGLTFTAVMKWKDYIESIVRSAAKKVSSLC